jgi:hypothetical protein
MLQAGRGVLLDLSGNDDADLAELGGYADRVDVVRAAVTPQHPGIGAQLVLLRPDGRVAWATDDSTGDDELRAALARWFGTPVLAFG